MNINKSMGSNIMEPSKDIELVLLNLPLLVIHVINFGLVVIEILTKIFLFDN